MALSLRESILDAHDRMPDPQYLVERIRMLDPRDAALLEAVLVRGASAASLARMMGLPRQTVRKRVLSLTRRINSVRFRKAAGVLHRLEGDERQVALLHFCQGLPISDLTDWLDLSPWATRQAVERVRAKIDALHRVRCLQAAAD